MSASRRDFLLRSWNGIGGLALSQLLTDDLSAAAAADPMAVKPQHFPRKAKRCIYLFMAGGASQIDTFDYKPKLRDYAGKAASKAAGTVGRNRRLSGCAAPHDSESFRVQTIRQVRPLHVDVVPAHG